MNTFTKYLLLNLLLLVPAAVLIYWLAGTESSNTTAAVSEKLRFLVNVDETHRLYETFKKSVASGDISQREQDKVNLEQQLTVLASASGNTATLGVLIGKVDQNYKRLISLHIMGLQNRVAIEERKSEVQSEIDRTEKEIESLKLRIAILQSKS